MFTGIITDVGRIAAIERHGDIRFLVETSFDTSTIAIGASIAHNGCCLTVIETPPGRYSVEVSAETLAKTTLRSEEHTSELQSLMRISYAVFCLKQKNTKQNTTHNNNTTN